MFVTTWPTNIADKLPEISTQRVDVDVFVASFRICSGSFRDLELEAEAVHEITAVSPPFLARPGSVRRSAQTKNCSTLSSISSVPVSFITGPISARSSKRFAVDTGGCGVATGRGRAWFLGRAGATEWNPPASERMDAEPGQGG